MISVDKRYISSCCKNDVSIFYNEIARWRKNSWSILSIKIQYTISNHYQIKCNRSQRPSFFQSHCRALFRGSCTRVRTSCYSSHIARYISWHRWNFDKFIVDHTGDLSAVFPASVEPLEEEVIAAIEKVLAELPQNVRPIAPETTTSWQDASSIGKRLLSYLCLSCRCLYFFNIS